MPNEWVKTEIRGLSDLERKLESLPEKVEKKALRATLMKGARILVSAFVAFAPRRTGFLAEHFNIKLSLRAADHAGHAYIGPEGRTDYPLEGGGYTEKKTARGRTRKVGRVSVASVARWLEFGTSKMAARPFMTPAWESHKEIVRDEIISTLAEGVEEAAKEQ